MAEEQEIISIEDSDHNAWVRVSARDSTVEIWRPKGDLFARGPSLVITKRPVIKVGQVVRIKSFEAEVTVVNESEAQIKRPLPRVGGEPYYVTSTFPLDQLEPVE